MNSASDLNVRKLAWLPHAISNALSEHYDEQGTFHYADWDPAEGMTRRSKRLDKVIIDRGAAGVEFDFASLILDARKPGNFRP